MKWLFVASLLAKLGCSRIARMMSFILPAIAGQEVNASLFDIVDRGSRADGGRKPRAVPLPSPQACSFVGNLLRLYSLVPAQAGYGDKWLS
jgi:hypothetical protein